jgi:hypothetical protein
MIGEIQQMVGIGALKIAPLEEKPLAARSGTEPQTLFPVRPRKSF